MGFGVLLRPGVTDVRVADAAAEPDDGNGGAEDGGGGGSGVSANNGTKRIPRTVQSASKCVGAAATPGSGDGVETRL